MFFFLFLVLLQNVSLRNSYVLQSFCILFVITWKEVIWKDYNDKLSGN